MPKRVPVTNQDLAWLRQNASTITVKDVSAYFNCCVDTAKRILHRNDIIHFDGAKYEKRRDHDLKMWNRPCMGCKSTESRPKNQYFCDVCRERNDMDNDHDGWV
jgi:hypothetical protein